MIPTHLGKYRILQLLAAGGMGEVFLARQEGPAGFAKPAVVKRILAHLAREPGFVEMFLDEARLAAVLNHPNVVQIFELGEADGTWFIAMEFLHGRSVRALFKEAQRKGEQVRPAQAARILSQALTGLHYAHHATGENGEALGIVHRDMSPDNVMVGFNGVVKVLDFGIAKAATALTTTRTGTVKGKFAYMAPEQLLAEKLDGRTDVYAVGVMLYELLAGARPFVAPTEAALVNLILNTPVMPLEQKAPHVPAELAAVVMKALEKNKASRWNDAEEFATALERFVQRTGEPANNASTAAYLKDLFGPAALDNPSMVTPNAGPLPSVDVTFTAPLTTPPVKAETTRRVAVPLVAAGLVGVGLLAAAFVWRAGPPPVAAPPAPVAVLAAPVAEAVDAGPAELAPEPVPEPEPTVKKGPSRGKLDLRVNPWGEVFENGKSLGVTPMAPLDLPAGAHRLVVKNSELKVTRTLNVRVPRGGTATVRVDLLE